MRIATLNVRGLNDFQKQRKFILFCETQNFDVIFVQETHIDNFAKAQRFEHLWGGKVFWGFGTNFSSGVAIMVKPNFQFEFISSLSGEGGKILSVCVKIKDLVYNFLSVYAPCKWKERLPFLRLLPTYIDNSARIVLAGDFNFIKDPEIDYRGPATNFTVPTQGSVILDSICSNYNLADVYRSRFPDRVNFTCNARQSFSRLDRIFISTSLLDFVSHVNVCPVGFSDHSSIVLAFKNPDEKRGPGYWKCNVSILTDPNLSADIRHQAEMANLQLVKDAAWWEDLKNSFRRIVRIHSVRLANIRKFKMSNLENSINRMSSDPTADGVQLTQLKAELDDCYDYILKGDAIRAHLDSLQELPQSFLKQQERSNGLRKRMDRLNTVNGVLTDSPSILRECFDFYANLYSSEPVDESVIDYFTNDLPQVPENLKTQCDGLLTVNECLDAINRMDSSKAPGSDGLPCEFYKLFFPLFATSFVEMINNCFERDLLPDSLRHGVITLLCKDEAKSENLNSWRPISLLNIDYKIVSKALANRLKAVIASVVHSDQTCAIPGRSIIDNLHLIRNIFDYAQSVNTPIAILALDQAKAFDRVSHVYLFRVLRAFGFGENFVRWITLCYSQCTSQVIVNGFLSESFDISRSIRQGCGLSALLYVLCAEPFAHRVRMDGSICGLALPGAPDETRVSQYADDFTAVVCSAGSVDRLFYLADLYCSASGAMLNRNKCQGILLGSLAGSKTFYPTFDWSTKPIKICGILFGTKDTAAENWSLLATSVQSTNIPSHALSLTFQGKARFLNMFIFSQIWYVAQVCYFTVAFLKELNKFVNRFLWGKTPPLVPRKHLICQPEEGGLGLVNVSTRAEAYGVKHMRDVITLASRKPGDEPPPRWFYLARYFAGHQLRRFAPNLASNCFSHAVEPTRFYKHCLQALTKICPKDKPAILPTNCKISDIYRVLILDVRELKSMRPNASLEGWNNLSNKIVSPRARDLSWRLAHDILPNAAKLFRFKAVASPKCAFCLQPETASHLFYFCPFASELWRRLARLVGRAFGPNFVMSQTDVVQSRIPATLQGQGHRSLYMILTTELKEVLWQARCRAVKEQEIFDANKIWHLFLNRAGGRCRLDFKRLKRQLFVDIWCGANVALCQIVESRLIVHF